MYYSNIESNSLLCARARAREDPLALGFVQHDLIHNAKSCMVGDSIFLGTADKILNILTLFAWPVKKEDAREEKNRESKVKTYECK